MKLQFSPKIWPSKLFADLKREPEKGVMTLISVFIFFIFSTLGLSLLYLSQLYLKLSAFKKNSTLLDYASENGIKQGYSQLLSLISERPSPTILSPDETERLKEDARNFGLKLSERALGKTFPFVSEEEWKNMSWRVSANCFLERLREKDNYFLTTYKVVITSEGKMKNFKATRKSTLEASLGIIAGHVPLPYFPLLMDKKLDQKQKENFMEKNQISFLPAQKSQIQPHVSFSEKDLLPQDANSLLAQALKIKIFRPQNLRPSELRAILGLERQNKPIPEGVYLIKDDLGLGGVYVHGDLEEMITAIEAEFQVISFRVGHNIWTLKFSPSKGKTFFSTPTETFSYDLLLLSIIVVDGKINSLGGGRIDSSGQAVLVKDEEIPSILRGVNLTIISSDRITLSSHLLHQGVKWQESIPYVKDSDSQLVIFSTGKDFWQNKEREGEIIVDKNSPQETKIQGFLTASDMGFTIEGERKTVHILGSLQASQYLPNENTLRIAYDERLLEDANSPKNAPETRTPVLYTLFLKILEWQEY